MVGVGNIAVLDSLFSFFVTATLTAFYCATDSAPGSAGEKRFLLLAGLACGLAFLTKGFLAFALPVVVLVPYLVWQRRHADLLRMGGLSMIAALLVALPWSILIHLREPDFWRVFFWNEHIRRFMAPGAQHRESFWFFFMAAPGLFMPWTFVIPPAVAGIRHLRGDPGPQGRLTRFSICWLVLPFLFFSAANGKLLTYILPCLPPFAVLMALGLTKALRKGNSRVLQWGIAATGVLFGMILLALIGIQLFGYGGSHFYRQPWKAMMAVNGLVFMVLFCFWSLRSQSGEGKILLLGLAPLLLLFLAHFTTPDFVIQHSAPGRFLENHRTLIKPETVIIAGEESAGAVCWNLKRDDVYVMKPAGELTYGLHYKDAAGRLLDADSATRLIERNRGKTVLIARADRIRDLRHALPAPACQTDSGPGGYALWQY